MPELSIILPCYNEAASIQDVVRRVLALPVDKQIVVVDDGSTDGSDRIIRSLPVLPELSEPVFHARNLGKGMAIRSALSRLTGEYTIVQDTDTEYDPADIPALLNAIRNREGTVVYGSRQARATRSRYMFGTGVSLLNRLARRLYDIELDDIMTCYKLTPTVAIKSMDLQCVGFEFCTEFTAKACRMGYGITEVPISYHPRTRGQGKKIRLRDGYKIAHGLWKYRNWTANPLPENGSARAGI